MVALDAGSVAGVGPALIDYIHLIDSFPQPGGHAIVSKTHRVAGGAAANVIYGLSKLGITCRFYSTIGKDNDADLFRKSMEEVGVELVLNVTHARTGRVDVYVDSAGERTFFVHPNAAGNPELRIRDEDFRLNDFFYLDPFPSPASFEVHLEVAERAKEHDCNVILNPGYPYTSLGFRALKELLQHVDMLILSQPEFSMLGVSEAEMLRYVKILVITLGRSGSVAVTREGRHFRPAYEVRAVDTTGAGDAFAAGFLYGYIKGYEIDRCLEMGNFAASYCIQRVGARNFPEKDEIERIA